MNTLFDDSKQAGWIIVVGWRKFQHYGEARTPIWIKTYLDLLDRDEYQELPGATRAVLHGIWLLTARSRGTVRARTRNLSRALGLKVTSQQLEALRHAGFIEFSASKPASNPLAKVEDLASAEVEEEKEKEEKDKGPALNNIFERPPKSNRTKASLCSACGIGGGLHLADCVNAVRQEQSLN